MMGLFAFGGLFVGILLIGVAIGVWWGLRRDHPAPAALEEAAHAMGLAHAGDRFKGRYHGRRIALIYADNALMIVVDADAPFAGMMRLSGPSPNAGTGTPEVKLTVGDGAFDHHFWIAESNPRDFAKTLLAPLDDVRRAMLDAPFGVWRVAGKSVIYERTLPFDTPDDVQQIAAVLTKIAASD